MNTISTLSAPTNRFLASLGILPRRESIFNHMCQAFTLQESIRMAYVPLFLTKAAFRFAEEVCRQCAARHLPHKKEVRIIRQAMHDYTYSTLGASISPSTLKILDQKTDLLFTTSSDNIQTLWFVINHQLKKTHPSLDEEYPFLTDIFCAVSIIHYARRYERTCDYIVRQRTGLDCATFATQEPVDVYNALLTIAGPHNICHTDMAHLAIRIISMKVDTMVIELSSMYKDEMKKE